MISLCRWILLLALVSAPVAAKEIDFTRYLGDHALNELSNETTFTGTVGEGRLMISALPNTNLTVSLNGKTVATVNESVEGNVEFNVGLLESNTITVNVTSPPP
ncbi:MAG: hypothetical protein O3C68_10430, partial [Proteobacteria bacterium]|nr:hypothetical protein [Pseudomonadota bacterium]